MHDATCSLFPFMAAAHGLLTALTGARFMKAAIRGTRRRLVELMALLVVLLGMFWAIAIYPMEALWSIRQPILWMVSFGLGSLHAWRSRHDTQGEVSRSQRVINVVLHGVMLVSVGVLFSVGLLWLLLMIPWLRIDLGRFLLPHLYRFGWFEGCLIVLSLLAIVFDIFRGQSTVARPDERVPS